MGPCQHRVMSLILRGPGIGGLDSSRRRSVRPCQPCQAVERASRLASQRPGAVPQHALADALVSEPRAVIADLRSDRDHWREQAQRLALGAPTMRGAESPALSWWRWLRSTG